MNMQRILQEAQKMQAQIQKEQKELEGTIYEGNSSIVSVKMNGKYQVVEVKVNLDEAINASDKEMLEDMILLAVNDATKKIAQDKEKKMGKFGQGLAGLM